MKILSHLAVKMGPNVRLLSPSNIPLSLTLTNTQSRLIIFEHIVQSNAIDSSSPSVSKALSEVSSISKAGERYEPIGDVAFVPGSFGRASNLPLFLSYSMTCLFNGGFLYLLSFFCFVFLHPSRSRVESRSSSRSICYESNDF